MSPGTGGPARRRRALLAVLAAAAFVAAPACVASESNAFKVEPSAWPDDVSFALALYQSLGVHMRPGHQVELVDNGAVFDALVEEIGRARTSVHLMLYIWEKGAASDRVVAALAGRDPAVECRILVDAFGSSKFDEELRGPLTAAGCEVRMFRPFPGADEIARNHRKIVVVDGEVAITGGFGMRDDWLGAGRVEHEWRDTNVRFRGPAVAEAQQAFAENWQEVGGDLLPAHAFPPQKSAGAASAAFVTSTASPVITRAERLVQLMIAAGRQRVWISMAYFVPTEGILDLLKRKADAGVDVRLLVAGQKSDSKTSWGSQQLDYGELTSRGVRVWEYEPTMMHAKTLLVDDRYALVGSANLDPLALGKLEEAGLVVDDPALNAELAARFERDCEFAEPVSP